MRLLCGCATHTYGLDISKPDLTFKAECLKAQAEIERKAAAYDAALACVNKQAENGGLWFVARTGAEAYLQQELRKLHAVIEQDAEHPASHEPVSKTQAETLPSSPSGTLSESRRVSVAEGSEVEGKEP